MVIFNSYLSLQEGFYVILLESCVYIYIYGFHKRWIPPIAGWSIMENHIKVDDLGGNPISGNHYIYTYMCIICILVSPLPVTGGETSQLCFSFSCGSITLW